MNCKRNDVFVGIAAAAFPVTSTKPCIRTVPLHAVTIQCVLGAVRGDEQSGLLLSVEMGIGNCHSFLSLDTGVHLLLSLLYIYIYIYIYIYKYTNLESCAVYGPLNFKKLLCFTHKQ
jgi:hypothetical protein